MEVTQESHTLSLIFTIAVVASILIQAAVFVGLYFAVSTAFKKLTKISSDLSLKAMPIIGSVNSIVENVKPKVQNIVSGVDSVVENVKPKVQNIVSSVESIVEDVKPKVQTVTGHIVDISSTARDMASTVRDQTKHVNSTVDEVVDKTRVQAEKVSDMVSAVLGSIVHAGNAVQSNVSKPARQIGGIIRGIRVGLDSLLSFKKHAKSSSVAPEGSSTTGNYHNISVEEPPVTHVEAASEKA